MDREGIRTVMSESLFTRTYSLGDIDDKDGVEVWKHPDGTRIFIDWMADGT